MRPLLGLLLLVLFAQGQAPPRITGRIRIERTTSGGMRFQPAELVAWAGDQIHWFNDTADVHEPGVLKKDGSFVAFLDDPVSARSSSAVFSPLARIDDKSKNQLAFTIHYVCGRHRDEQGVIQVIPTP